MIRSHLPRAMATKRSASAAASASQDPAKKAKRQVSVATFKKWQTNYEQEYQSLTWLCCDVDERDRSLVGLLWCAVCRRFEERIRGVNNFSNVWVTGSTNHKSSNVLDHGRNLIFVLLWPRRIWHSESILPYMSLKSVTG